jgi:hypothetical protein
MTVAVGPARPPQVAERGPAHVAVGGPAIGGLARSPRRYLNPPGSAGASNRRPHPEAAHSRVTTAAAGLAAGGFDALADLLHPGRPASVTREDREAPAGLLDEFVQQGRNSVREHPGALAVGRHADLIRQRTCRKIDVVMLLEFVCRHRSRSGPEPPRSCVQGPAANFTKAATPSRWIVESGVFRATGTGGRRTLNVFASWLQSWATVRYSA